MTKNKKGYHSFQWEDLYMKPYKTTKRYIIIALGVLGTALALSFIFIHYLFHLKSKNIK